MLRILDEDYYWSPYNSTSGFPLPPGVIEGGWNAAGSASYVCSGYTPGHYYPATGLCWYRKNEAAMSKQNMDLLLTPTGLYVINTFQDST